MNTILPSASLGQDYEQELSIEYADQLLASYWELVNKVDASTKLRKSKTIDNTYGHDEKQNNDSIIIEEKQ
jgi:hypothetical protein